MQVKVIKPINGLEEGDILSYNEKTHKYEIKKMEEDISDSGYSSKKTLHTYSKNTVLDNTDYFEFIDSDGDRVEIKNTVQENTAIYDITSNEGKKVLDLLKTNDKLQEEVQDWKSECIKLHNKVIELEIFKEQLTEENYRLQRQLEKSRHWPFYSLI